MLVNLWYVAEESNNVKDKPVHVQLLGQKFVLFRDEHGRVHCLSDVCIHRGGSLSRGWCKGSTVVCPYHGWRFDQEGQCTLIPSNPSVKINPRARVDAYPCEERYGMIWVFMGDDPPEKRIPIPPFPEYGTKGWREVRTSYTWRAEAARVVENGIDIAHAAFVHPIFGLQEEAGASEILKIEDGVYGPYSCTSTNRTVTPALKGGLRRFIRRDRAETKSKPTFLLSGMVVRMHIFLNQSESMQVIMFDANTPVDEHTTKTFAIQLRNFFRFKAFDKGSLKRLEQILIEDANIVEHAAPNYLPEDLHNEISVKADQFMGRFRAMRRDWIKRGNQIDLYEIRKHEGRKAFSIPSPGRHPKAGNGLKYVIDAVPCVANESVDAPREEATAASADAE